MSRLDFAAERFRLARDAETTARYQQFCQEHAQWLDDFALFMTLAEASGWRDWCIGTPLWRAVTRRHWRKPMNTMPSGWLSGSFANGVSSPMASARRTMPMLGHQDCGRCSNFLAHQSAEVWCRPELFELDGHGRPTVIAGVPPDVFSATGQRWGNPLTAGAPTKPSIFNGGYSAFSVV